MKYFMCYESYREGVDSLTDEEAGRLFKALFRFNESGEEGGLTGAERVAFSFIRQQMQRDRAEYQSKCDRMRENGRRKGAKKDVPEDEPVQSGSDGEQIDTEEKQIDIENEQIDSEKKQIDLEKEQIDCKVKGKRKKENINHSLYVVEPMTRAHAREAPTVEEVADYCREHGLAVNADRFVAFNRARGWMIGNTSITDWRPLLEEWAKTEQKTAPPRNRVQYDVRESESMSWAIVKNALLEAVSS